MNATNTHAIMAIALGKVHCVRSGGNRFGHLFTYPLAYANRKVYKLYTALYYMRKIIKTLGSGLGIYFTTDDRITYNLKKGDIIDLTITRVDKEVKDE